MAAHHFIIIMMITMAASIPPSSWWWESCFLLTAPQQKHAPWWSSKHGLPHAGPYCVFSKNAIFDIWTTGCISLYCLTDAEVGPLRLCFCSVSGTLEFSRLLLSSGPLDSWILDAAQYQQLYIMIIFLIYNTWCTILFFMSFSSAWNNNPDLRRKKIKNIFILDSLDNHWI